MWVSLRGYTQAHETPTGGSKFIWPTPPRVQLPCRKVTPALIVQANSWPRRGEGAKRAPCRSTTLLATRLDSRDPARPALHQADLAYISAPWSDVRGGSGFMCAHPWTRHRHPSFFLPPSTRINHGRHARIHAVLAVDAALSSKRIAVTAALSLPECAGHRVGFILQTAALLVDRIERQHAKPAVLEPGPQSAFDGQCVDVLIRFRRARAGLRGWIQRWPDASGVFGETTAYISFAG